MEAQMEVRVESSFDWKRLLVPTGIVALVLALAGGGFYVFKSKKSGGSDAVNAAAAAGAAKKKDGKDGKDEKAPVPVNVAAVTAAPISSYISATANIVAENEVKIIAEAEGRVERLLVEEGDYVRQGSTLATLVRGDAQMLLDRARVRASNARIAFNRAKDLNTKDLMPQADYEKIVMEKDVAQAELAEAEWRLSKTTIRAPFTGRVTLRNINAGQHVRPGAELFTLTDFEPLIARIFLPERDVIALNEGRDVQMTLRAASDVVFRGRIRQISPVVDTATGTVKVTVEAVQPPAAVRPGAFVTVAIVRETRPTALRVPREAVIRELRDAHVFVAEKGVAKRRDITLGIEEGNYVEAISGIKAGEQVIVAGQGALKDGSAVKVQTKS